MNNEISPNLLTLIDEEGYEHNFEVLDVIENDRGSFYALLPVFDNPEDSIKDDGTYYIFEGIEENGEQQLAEIEDEELLDQLAEMFEKRFDEIYEYIENEEAD